MESRSLLVTRHEPPRTAREVEKNIDEKISLSQFDRRKKNGIILYSMLKTNRSLKVKPSV